MIGARTVRWLRWGAFAAAFAGVVFLAIGAAWWHVDNPGSADTCPICRHVAHFSVVPEMPAASLAAPAAVAWLLPSQTFCLPGEPSVAVPPSRAPPA